MSKYYRVDQDDFEALPFYSEWDEGYEGHSIIIKECNKEEFIAEQISRFTLHLLSILNEMPTREEVIPFNRISSKYTRQFSAWFGTYIVCPHCGGSIREEEWNSNTNDMRSCCYFCEGEIEME